MTGESSSSSVKHRKDKKEKSAERKRDRKKHKRHHDSDGSSSEGEVQAEAPTWPWHRMAFDLVDGINGYGGATPDSRTLLGMASDGSAAVDMSEYTRLVDYLRDTFQINAELRVVLRVEVRTNLRMQACASTHRRAPVHGRVEVPLLTRRRSSRSC